MCLQLLLYAYLPYKHTMRWEYVGRCRSHHGPIASVVFGESPSGQTRLLSGERQASDPTRSSSRRLMSLRLLFNTVA